jgi:hypothetical protein
MQLLGEYSRSRSSGGSRPNVGIGVASLSRRSQPAFSQGVREP